MSFLTFSFYVLLGAQNNFFTFPPQYVLHALLFYSSYLITLTTYGEEWKPKNSTLCSFVHLQVAAVLTARSFVGVPDYFLFP
jgi:hypothetical protein